MAIEVEGNEIVSGSGWKRINSIPPGKIGIYDTWRHEVVGENRNPVVYENDVIIKDKNNLCLKKKVYHVNFCDYDCFEVFDLYRDSTGASRLKKTGMYIREKGGKREKDDYDYYINFAEKPLVDGTSLLRIQNLKTKKFGVYSERADQIIIPVTSSNIYRAETGRTFMLNDEENKWYLIQFDSEQGKLQVSFFADATTQKTK